MERRHYDVAREVVAARGRRKRRRQRVRDAAGAASMARVIREGGGKVKVTVANAERVDPSTESRYLLDAISKFDHIAS
ncbi:hypothetical protein KSP40_PGU011267 [Platanthera guangdongensis]|uniref:Uncharacterized protein n=1 Tax=Platanthera guangdongensis TaxID=2320717 RepID=A0ABR2N655_9ASPA